MAWWGSGSGKNTSRSLLPGGTVFLWPFGGRSVFEQIVCTIVPRRRPPGPPSRRAAERRQFEEIAHAEQMFCSELLDRLPIRLADQ